MSNATQMQPVLDRIDADFDNSLERLFALLRIKSISADPAFAGDCRKAADHLAEDIASLGFATEVRPTAGHPAIVAKSNGSGQGNGKLRPHVLFYGHYDVQPVDPLNLWHRPPFEPEVTTHADGRKIIVARGAEDDKGQVMTFVEACRAWKSVTGSLPVDITIIIEGEEEIGSKNFVPFLEKIKDELKADFALVCDTGMWDPNTPAITTSLRGLVYDEVKIKAANRDLHSGVFGGGAQNPIRVLTRILGGLFDDNGHITIPGFYDGVRDLPPDILAQWKKLNLTPEILPQADRAFDSRRRKGPLADRAGLLAADLRRQRHHRRLYRGRLQDGDPRGSLGENLVPAGRGTGSCQNSKGVPRLCFGAASGRLPGRIRRPFQRASDRARLEHEAARRGQARADGRVGQGSGADGFGRLDPDRFGFQAHPRSRYRSGRLRARRRQHPFAEREV